MSYDKEGSEVPHQGALLGKGEIRLHGHDHNEGEKAEDVKEAATKAGNVGLVKEGADQVTEGQDAQTIVAEEQEKEEAVAVGQDAAVLQHQCEDEDGQHQVGGALQEPGKEVAERVDPHHFHVLWEKQEQQWMEIHINASKEQSFCLQQSRNLEVVGEEKSI